MALCSAALSLRLVLGQALVGFPFLTFYPAVLLAAIAGGRGPGLVAALLSWALAWYFLPHPYMVGPWSPGGLLATCLYAFLSISLVMLVDAMNRAYAERISMRRANVQLRSLFNRAPSFIAMSSGPDHRLDLTNNSFDELCGRGSLVGKTIRQAVPELEGQGVFEVLDHVYAKGEPFVGEETPITLKTASGELQQRFINFVCTPVKEEDESVIGIFVEGFDVTEARRSRKEVQRLQSELIHVSRLSAMGTMASTLAHELNQPLTAALSYIRGARRVLDKDGQCPVEAQHGLSGAVEAVERAGAIIRSLREMSKKGVDESVVSPVGRIVGEAKKIALIGARQLGITYSEDIPPELEVRCDPLQLQQVFVNLIRNGVEASSAVEERQVRITAQPSGDAVEICVSDSGPGIDPKIRPHLFEAFQTTKQDGVGIGLSICRTIIEAHGGNIWAENGTGEGARICFALPSGNGQRD